METFKQYQIHKKILCIDLKSFYASVECAIRGLDPFTTPLVVADQMRGDGSIVLAVTPYLKQLGIPSRCRIFELPKDLNIIFAKPRLKTYLEYSVKVVEVYLEYVSEEDLYIYSVDEAFLDVTKYLKLYQLNSYQLAKEILNRIQNKLKLSATCGIGPNMLIAKLAMDLDAKKRLDFIAKWDYSDIPTKLWPVTPLRKMWGIGFRMEERLNKLGLFTIGDIAHYDVKKLKKEFGILGEELYYHCHGIDQSAITDKYLLKAKNQSYGIGQTLFKDYNAEEIKTIILEMTDDIVSRLRISKKSCKTIHLSIGYSKEYGKGFSRQTTLDYPTKHHSVIYQECLNLFDLFYEGYPIRQVAISLSNLTDSKIYQYSLFEDPELLEKDFQLKQTLDEIKERYGKNAVNRLVSETKHSTAKTRNKQIGGHNV
ncbi:MAG: Y-family DNA polymerase [Acholeplasmataceae bacterium]|nr:Y-family DNA polymerase [Acholeplasmataceae bacterium]